MGSSCSVAAAKAPDKKESRISRNTSLIDLKRQTSQQVTNMDESKKSAAKTDKDIRDPGDSILADNKAVGDNELIADNMPAGDNENETIADNDETKEAANEKDESKDEDSDGSEKPKEKLPPPTREEIEAMKIEAVEKVERHIDRMKDVEWTDENGIYVEGAKKLLNSFSFSYFALKRAPVQDRIESRRKIAHVILKSGIMTKVFGVVMDIYPKGWANEEKKTDMAIWKPLSTAFVFIHNYADASYEFAERVADMPGFLEMMYRILAESIESHLKQDLPVNRKKVMTWALSTVHNVSMAEATIPRLRSLNFTKVLEPYLQSPEKMIQLNCLASLAAIIDEKESEILNSNNSSVKYLMFVLRKGIGNPSRRCNGWSCKECALTLRMLARNDANKKLLVELGALELLVQLAKGSMEEQIEAVGAIWALSFDEENRKVMVENEDLGVVSTLLNLKTVDSDKIKAAANGALWNLRGDLEKSEKHHELGKRISYMRKKSAVQAKQVAETEEEVGHIMISYQWANQKTMIEVRDSLIANGIKVWMDIDQMGGSTLQAMADAVENANIVLIAMSHKYKDSPNCRAEAEYAFQQRKKIVPLLLERGYKPDGWLGFILGAKLFFDFSGKYPFETKINDLLKELGRIRGQSQSGSQNVIAPKKVEPNFHAPKVVDTTDSQHPVPIATPGYAKIADDVRKWTTDDVKNWINKNDLSVQKLGHLTAGEVALLIIMRREAPESFYKCIQETMKITDLLTISKLVWALIDVEK